MFKDVFIDETGGLRPWATYSVIAIAVFVGAYFVYGGWTRGDRPEPATRLCITEDCGYTNRMTLQIGDIIPYKCPRCEQDTVYPAVLCPNCRTPNVWNVERGLPGPTVCQCGTEIIRGN